MSRNTLSEKITIFTLYIIYCFDIAAIVVVFIIFTPLLLDSTAHFVRPEMSISNRNLILGFLIACYPIAQFFSCPILGDLSDHFGRKRILLISTSATAFCFFLSAIAILEESLPMLMISRLVGGFFAGNAALAQASVSDYNTGKGKARAMALFTMTGGFAWIIGPFIGAFFSNSKILPWFNFDVPFWLLGLLFFFATGILLFTMPKREKNFSISSPSLLNSLKSMFSVFRAKLLVTPLVCFGFYILGWLCIQTFNAPFLILKYNYSEQWVGYVFAWNSVWWLTGGMWAFFWFKSKRPGSLNAWTTFLVPLLVLPYAIIHYKYLPWFALAMPNGLMAITYSAFASLFTLLAPKSVQGRIFGAFTGLLALGSAVAPPLVGWLSRFSLDVPYYVASGICLISATFYLFWYIQNKKEIHQKGG